MKQMASVPKEQRPAVGRLVNEAKGRLQAQLDAALGRIEAAEIAANLGPDVDPTLPAPDPGPGTFHPLTQVREEMCQILRKVGFAVADGPEVETEFYCFDALNTPPDHPARDAQDTFYLPGLGKFRECRTKGSGRAVPAAHPHLVGADPDDARGGRPRSASFPREGCTAATRRTPRTRPISTSSSASAWTAA